MSKGLLRIGIDAGGSFTHAAALRIEDGALYTARIESNLSDPSQSFRDAILEVLESASAEPADILSIAHSTSAITSALLGKRTQNIALIVNKGFRHILEIGRQSVPDGLGSSYFWVKPGRVLPVDRIHEIKGRIDSEGKEVVHFDEEAALDLAYTLNKKGVEAVAVCLLHSGLNSAHESSLKKCFAKEFSGCHVSLSSEVLP